MLSVANAVSRVDPLNKIGSPAHRQKRLMLVPVLEARGIWLVSVLNPLSHWELY